MYRLTPRQAVVVIARSPRDERLGQLSATLPDDRFQALLAATLRDVLAAVIQVDGATVAVAAASPSAGAPIRAGLPAGIELLTPSHVLTPSDQGAWAVSQGAGRTPDRLLVLDSGTLGLSPWHVATALSALGSADVSVGGFSAGSAYAIGLNRQTLGELTQHPTRRGPGTLDRVLRGDLGSEAVISAARSSRWRVQRLEPRPTLDAFAGIQALSEYAAVHADTGRHVAAWLADCPATFGPDALPLHEQP